MRKINKLITTIIIIIIIIIRKEEEKIEVKVEKQVKKNNLD